MPDRAVRARGRFEQQLEAHRDRLHEVHAVAVEQLVQVTGPGRARGVDEHHLAARGERGPDVEQAQVEVERRVVQRGLRAAAEEGGARPADEPADPARGQRHDLRHPGRPGTGQQEQHRVRSAVVVRERPRDQTVRCGQIDDVAGRRRRRRGHRHVAAGVVEQVRFGGTRQRRGHQQHRMSRAHRAEHQRDRVRCLLGAHGDRRARLEPERDERGTGPARPQDQFAVPDFLVTPDQRGRLGPRGRVRRDRPDQPVGRRVSSLIFAA